MKRAFAAQEEAMGNKVKDVLFHQLLASLLRCLLWSRWWKAELTVVGSSRRKLPAPLGVNFPHTRSLPHKREIPKQCSYVSLDPQKWLWTLWSVTYMLKVMDRNSEKWRCVFVKGGINKQGSREDIFLVPGRQNPLSLETKPDLKNSQAFLISKTTWSPHLSLTSTRCRRHTITFLVKC